MSVFADLLRRFTRSFFAKKSFSPTREWLEQHTDVFIMDQETDSQEVFLVEDDVVVGATAIAEGDKIIPTTVGKLPVGYTLRFHR